MSSVGSDDMKGVVEVVSSSRFPWAQSLLFVAANSCNLGWDYILRAADSSSITFLLLDPTRTVRCGLDVLPRGLCIFSFLCLLHILA
ncbi:5656_t:CDS:1, partial [Paraglomus occultum]